MTEAEIAKVVKDLRKSFDAGRTRPLEWRLRQLKGLIKFMRVRENELTEAMQKDLGKPAFEAFAADLAFVTAEADVARKKLRRWMKPERVSTPMVVQPGKSRIVKEPQGVVLIIGAWNYPLQLTLGPLIGAISGGNCAVVKPSEVSPATSAAIAKYLPEYVDTECIQVVEGAVSETTALLNQRFDHVFYTGNGTVGTIVMQAAAKHLAPVTLELGGKSPCIVDKDVDLNVAARRLVWGKFYNAGQTCIAPDYVLAHKDVEEALIDGLRKNIREFYGENPKSSPDFARIVNQRHHQRLARLLDGNAEVAIGGEMDEKERYIAPTVLRNVKKDAAVMEDEIFGPILPVLTVSGVDEAIEFVNSRPKPLALYVFSRNSDFQNEIVQRTSSGGVCINHAMLHAANHNLPFGGVGPSGVGAYHGKHSFDVFTHRKPVLSKPTWLDPALLYPPYHDSKLAWIKRLM